MRIGFLYFYHEYHVYHSAPIAFELSRLEHDLEVQLLSTSPSSSQVLAQLMPFYPHQRCQLVELSPPWRFRFLNVEQRRFPSPRLMIQRHTETLKQLDVVVCTTNGMGNLLANAGLPKPKLIMAFHGAGDRAYGYRHQLSDFDLLLLSGPKKYQRLKDEGILRQDNWAVIGYPKFDLLQFEQKKGDITFPEDRPVVLYNPHFRRHLSSWYSWGRTILDFFVHSRKYNLIFAPHVEIKGRKQQWLTLRKYRKYPHIHIDLGSPRSYTMEYTRQADIYLGDVSSQVGEFMIRPRPCVFLNTHGVDWKDDPSYVHWHLGHVVDDPADLEDRLEAAMTQHEACMDRQIQYFKETFELTEEPSGLRAAKDIASFLKQH